MSVVGLEVRLVESGRRAEVDRVARALLDVTRSLKEIDSAMRSQPSQIHWELGNAIRRPDLVLVRIESERPGDLVEPATEFLSGIETLSGSPVVPDFYNPTTVARVAELSTPRNGVTQVELALANGNVQREVALTTAVRLNAVVAGQAHRISHGSVLGTVSRLGDLSRSGQITFGIRPDNSRHIVRAKAPDSLLDVLRGSWQHRCLLEGQLKRNSSGQLIEVKAQAIQVIPEPRSDYPDARGLAGVAPDWIGGVPSDVWLSEQRRA